MSKGVTLLEIIVVIALIAILSLFGVNTINNFKQDAGLDNAANELLSEIRVARSKSMNGEILADPATGKTEEASDFSEYGMPAYGIRILADSYELVRRYVKFDGSPVADECIKGDGGLCEKVFLDDSFSLAPIGSFYFERITGNFGGITLTIIEKKGGGGRKITITKDFSISVGNNVLGVSTSALKDWLYQIPILKWVFFALLLILPILLGTSLILVIQNWPH